MSEYSHLDGIFYYRHSDSSLKVTKEKKNWKIHTFIVFLYAY